MPMRMSFMLPKLTKILLTKNGYIRKLYDQSKFNGRIRFIHSSKVKQSTSNDLNVAGTLKKGHKHL